MKPTDGLWSHSQPAPNSLPPDRQRRREEDEQDALYGHGHEMDRLHGWDEGELEEERQQWKRIREARRRER